MTMATARPGVTSYLEAVRSHLHDLPDDERQDLLEDLEQHLSEVAAEGEGSLLERLGPPDAYAAELRSSVGLAGDGRRGVAERIVDRARRSPAGRLLRTLASTPTFDSLTSFVVSVRPGWWLLRGYILVVGAALSIGTYYFQPPLLPRLFGSQAPTLLAIAGGVWASVWLGRRAGSRKETRVASIVSTIAALGLGLLIVGRVMDVSSMAESASFEQDQTEEVVEYEPGLLHHPDGSPIANICPYGADGQRLSDVLLFDQDGRPITEVAPVTVDLAEVERTLPRAKDGQRIANAYPHELMSRNPDTGELEPRPCPSVLVPRTEEPGPALEAPSDPEASGPSP